MEQSLFQKLPGLVFIKDVHLRFTNASSEFIRHSGLKNVNQLVGLDDTQMPWADYALQYQKDDIHVMECGRLQHVETFVNACGDSFHMMVTKEPLYKNNKIEGIIGNSNILSPQLQKELWQLRTIDKVISPKKVAKYTVQSCYGALTTRESQIFFLLLRHFSAKKVAEKLRISSRTVEKHLEIIKHKLDLRSKNDIFDYAIQNHLVEIIITA